MTDVIAGQSVSLLGQFYDFLGGSLTDLDATPTIAVTSIASGTTALAATTGGVTHPGPGSYGYAWTPSSSLTPGDCLVTWSGLKSGAPVTATETVTVYAPASAAATNTSPDGIWYATREEIKAELDVKETARSNARIDRALADATRRVEGCATASSTRSRRPATSTGRPAAAPPRGSCARQREWISVGRSLVRRADDRPATTCWSR
jgi:hypothetical protein